LKFNLDSESCIITSLLIITQKINIQLILRNFCNIATFDVPLSDSGPNPTIFHSQLYSNHSNGGHNGLVSNGSIPLDTSYDSQIEKRLYENEMNRRNASKLIFFGSIDERVSISREATATKTKTKQKYGDMLFPILYVFL